MGKVIVTAKIESMEDLFDVDKGLIKPKEVRIVEVKDALVDTGATYLSMPKHLIAQLGLKPFSTQRAKNCAGTAVFQIYGPVRLTIQDRFCHCDISELPDDCPVLIGQLPLEQLDFVVDLKGQRLIGNPAHGGEQMIDMF